MKTVCEINKCCGCMACTNICKVNAIVIEDELEYYNAKINETVCFHCNQCMTLCPQNQAPEKHAPIEWYQGWAEEIIRGKSSSGGVASAVAKAFIGDGGCVAGCYFHNGELLFKIIEATDELDDLSGSKYVKSNPGNIYYLIQEKIKYQKVLFIGLPCQVAAVINFVKIEWRNNLYTIDLVCHGTPSPKILDCFLKDQNFDLSQVRSIRFRENNDFCIFEGERRLAPKGMQDRYTICFKKGLFHTENCYQCKYACEERVGDLTLGDSWGTELSEEERKKGISLMLIQNKKGRELIEKANLTLLDVSLERAISANHQLDHPIVAPPKRDTFFRNIRAGKSFDKAYATCYRLKYLKQEMKKR